MSDWICINPTLSPDTGAFAALSHLPRAAELTPVPLDATTKPFSLWWDQELSFDFSVGVQLGVASVADVTTSFRTRTVSYDVFLRSDAVTPTAHGGLIQGTRWGAGLRTRVDVTNFDAKFDLTLPNVAAAASIGLVDASFSVEGLGVADPGILKLLPGPGRFDEASYAQVLKAISAARTKLSASTAGLSAVPFMILVKDPKITFAAPVDRAHAQLWAVRRIRDGISQKVAVAQAQKANIDTITVQTVYTQWANTSDASPVPAADAKRRAQAWLDRAHLG